MNNNQSHETNSRDEYLIILGLLSGIIGSGLLQGVAEVAGGDNRKGSVYFIGSSFAVLFIVITMWKYINTRSRIGLLCLLVGLSVATYYFFFK